MVSRSRQLADLPVDGARIIPYRGPTEDDVVRTLERKLRDIDCVKDKGAECDSSTDDTAAIQKCCDLGGAFFVPFGSVIKLTAPITISKPVSFYGPGCVAYKDLDETAANVRGDGAWFHIAHTGKGFVIDGTSGSSDSVATIRFEGVGTFRTQPTPGGGAFTPTAHEWDFDATDCELQLSDFVCLNPTKFLIADLTRGGRVRLENVRGQPLQRGISIDNCYDVCHLDVHFWPYWSLNANVEAYTRANLQALITGRVDGITAPRFFTINHNIGWLAQDTGAGGVNRANFNLLYFDNGARGLVLTASGASIVAQNFIAYGLSAAASRGLEVSGSNNTISIDRGDFESFYNQAIYLDGTGNRLEIDRPKLKNWGYVDASERAIVNGAGNSIILNGPLDSVALPSRQIWANSGFVSSPDQWFSYTPTVSATAGTITTVGAVSAQYRVFGDAVDISFSIAITTNGTGAGQLQFSLPYSAALYAVGSGREVNATGALCAVQANVGGSVALISTYNNGYPMADGRLVLGSLRYRKS